MSLKKNIFKVFSVNFFSMISSVLISFLVPMILSVEDYSYVKTYTFYISYITFFSLGFVDGMYIKYGGKDYKEIDKSILKMEHDVFIVLQIIFTIFILILAIKNKSVILFLMAISIIPINVVGFYNMFYQATGQFNKYSINSYMYILINLILNILLVIIFNNKNYIFYCLTTLIANIVLFIFLEIKFYFNYRKIKYNKKENVFNNIKVGFFILLGNLSVMMFYAIDRWFIKIFYTVNDFAYYSFAISMLNIVNLLIGAISVTFYNYLAKEKNMEKLKELKKYFLILGSIASLSYFVLAAVVNIFMIKYLPSLQIIAISFATYPYMIVINALYINLYKTNKDEKKYLRVVLYMLILSIIYNLIATFISKDSIGIAIATMISFITWYIYSAKDFNYIRIEKKEYLYLFILSLSFLITSNFLNYLLGGTIYLIIIMFLNWSFLGEDLKNKIHELVRNFKK